MENVVIRKKGLLNVTFQTAPYTLLLVYSIAQVHQMNLAPVTFAYYQVFFVHKTSILQKRTKKQCAIILIGGGSSFVCGFLHNLFIYHNIGKKSTC
jgi:hypothetical protein